MCSFVRDLTSGMHIWNLFGALVNISAAIAQKPDVKDSTIACELDSKTGLPDGWKSTEISLDIVIILDTSEAMGVVAVTDATILIDSLFGSEEEESLIPDPRAEIFTRIGLIAVADEVQILHNLNMTKADTIQGKVSASNGIAEMDFEKAFEAARVMLNDGLHERPERTDTRKVIYIITHSEPKHLIRIAEEFKQSDGIVIVNQLIFEYEDDLPVLEKLASDGYYFVNAHDNNMDIIQHFCKAFNSHDNDKGELQLSSIPVLSSSTIKYMIRRIWSIVE